jgi:hypothetical protein
MVKKISRCPEQLEAVLGEIFHATFCLTSPNSHEEFSKRRLNQAR